MDEMQSRFPLPAAGGNLTSSSKTSEKLRKERCRELQAWYAVYFVILFVMKSRCIVRIGEVVVGG